MASSSAEDAPAKSKHRAGWWINSRFRKWVQKNVKSSSPWRFTDDKFEAMYLKSSRKAAARYAIWIVVLAVPISFQIAGDLLGVFSRSPDPHDRSWLVKVAWALRIATAIGFSYPILAPQPPAAQGKALQQAARIFGLAVAYEINCALGEDSRLFELALRWMGVCFLVIPEYGEILCWFIAVLGLRPLICLIQIFAGAPSSVLSRFDLLLLCFFLSASLIMYAVVGGRRRNWTKQVVNETLAGTKRLKPAADRATSAPPSGWHDDYFSQEQWSSLTELVREETEEIVKRRVRAEEPKGPADVKQHLDWVLGGQLLGRGTYGAVRMGRNRNTNKLCAIKVAMLSEREKKGDVEGRILGVLQHPNIVCLLEQLFLVDRHVLVLELCEFGSLQSVLHNCGCLDIPAAAWFSKNILLALHFLHRNRISHRDLKPGNVLLAREGDSVVAKLADFGSSVWIDEGPRKMKIQGTPAYMAPEILDADASLRRTDIWSLGCCVVEMLTGKVFIAEPAKQSSIAAYLKDVKSHYLRRLPAGLSEDTAPGQLVRACLRVDPYARPTALELLEHSFLEGAQRCPAPAASACIGALLRRPAATMEGGEGASAEDDLGVLPQLDMAEKPWSFYLSPAVVWRLLLDLEQPFLDAEVEEDFHRTTVERRITGLGLVLQVFWPCYYGYAIPQIIQSIRAHEALGVPRAVNVCISCWLVYQPLLPFAWLRCSRASYLSIFQWCMRVGVVLVCLAPHNSSFLLIPITHCISFAYSQITPLAAEALAMGILFTLAQTLHLLSDLYRDCDSVDWWDYRSVSKRLDHTLSSIVNLVGCAIIFSYLIIYKRVQDRSSYRNELTENAFGPRQTSDASNTMGLGGSSSPSAWPGTTASSPSSTTSHGPPTRKSDSSQAGTGTLSRTPTETVGGLRNRLGKGA